jgi:hypothetical protein
MATGAIDSMTECKVDENETIERSVIATMETVISETNIATVQACQEEQTNEVSIDMQKLPTLPFMYAYTTADGSQFIRIDTASQFAATQFTPVNAIADQGFVFVQDMDMVPKYKVPTTSTVLDQGTPVLVLNNTGRGTFEANVVFDQCNVQPVVQPQTTFQSLQALAHANLLQQTQEKIAKELGVDLTDSEQRKPGMFVHGGIGLYDSKNTNLLIEIYAIFGIESLEMPDCKI